jgi:hypothetical protein
LNFFGHFQRPMQPGCTIEVLPVPPGQRGQLDSLSPADFLQLFSRLRRSEIAATRLSAHALRSLRRARQVLLALREQRGFDMTQAQVARRIRVAQSYRSALERGEKEPGAAVLLAISREFGKSVDWLLTGK